MISLVVLVDQSDGRAEHDLVARQRRRIDDDGAGELVLELHHLRLDMALALLGGMVFGVLRQVAVGARGLDILDVLRPLDLFEVAQQSP